ncbi:DUF2637 domain-containing protein [Thermostaphylospora chromogena]|uniref:DUF2637 domain-containing protein n=1 Tax=Thermostaphylospora chromogena TaxID=35622 RepID=A0A1H1HE32_9ACTN|nr:DUF2637 domain-containing protein [Thermostaphylospora chromogena]SDR05489.1 Protein of unknown function [Thermostaphylospora chromogena]SDR23715.1 Protein of unknown function [Thermostaphylospora chromogena]
MSARRSGRLRSAVVDSGPVIVLALIAAVGSFTHISHLAARHGQKGWQSWAVAVCIDLMCVMAARELQRDKRTGRRRRGLISWPGLVLAGGIVLTLAANLAQAEPSPWGWITAATPAVAFLVAVSMLERRASHGPAPRTETAPTPVETAPLTTAPVVSAPAGPDAAERDAAGPPADLVPAVPPPSSVPTTGPADALVAYARRVATEHATKHGSPITRDALRQRLRVSPELAADLLAQIHTAPEPA